MSNTESIFSDIVLNNKWANSETPCGPGSTMNYTENLRKNFPTLLNKFNIQSMFDGPCGDFNWMQNVLKEPSLQNFKYIGGDIVKPMIEQNNIKYSNENIKFIHVDITKDPLPKVDMMMCRDCLAHLSFENITKLLNNFVDSNISYFFATSYTYEGVINHDIQTGGYRGTNLFLPPFNFPKDILYQIVDFVNPWPPRNMMLWSREQIIQSLKLSTK